MGTGEQATDGFSRPASYAATLLSMSEVLLAAQAAEENPLAGQASKQKRTKRKSGANGGAWLCRWRFAGSCAVSWAAKRAGWALRPRGRGIRAARCGRVR